MVKEDEAFDPAEVGFFGAEGVMSLPHEGTDLVKKFRGMVIHKETPS
jgi:hypothetical protein